MTHRQQFLSLVAFAALSLVATGARADDNTTVADNGSYERTAPLSCAEATAAAWFYRQLELTDGDTSPEVPTPAECRNEKYAQGNDAK